jgi:arginyl-tRNA synthetase
MKSSSGETDHLECHLVRRDTEYRLSIRSGKTVLVQELYRSARTAAERAEDLRRQAMCGLMGPGEAGPPPSPPNGQER